MGKIQNDNFHIAAPKPIDDRYLAADLTPYADTAAALTRIPLTERYRGMTVMVGTTEYWLRDSLTTLVAKNTGGGLSDGVYGDITVSAGGTLLNITAGAISFLELNDVPFSYAGNALKSLRVNAGATALEFYTPSSTIDFQNGLTESGGVAGLGGPLDNSTGIDFGIYSLTLGVSPSARFQGTSSSVGLFHGDGETSDVNITVTSDTARNYANGENGSAFILASSSPGIEGSAYTQMRWNNALLTESVTLSIGTSTTLNDGRIGKKGIEYSATGYVTQLHSLTDKEYVDTYLRGYSLSNPSALEYDGVLVWLNEGSWSYVDLSTLLTTFEDGITRIDGVARLGGSLSAPVNIDIGSSPFTLLSSNGSNLQFARHDAGILVNNEDETLTSQVFLQEDEVGFESVDFVSGDRIYFTVTTSTSDADNGTGAIFNDGRAVKRGIEYLATGYVTQLHSLTDKEYVDGRLAGKSIVAPTIAEDGKSIIWDNGTNGWIYYTPGTNQYYTVEDVSASTYNFSSADNGKVKRFINACTATVPTGLPDGWSVIVYRAAGGGLITINASGTYEGVANTIEVDETLATLFHRGANVIVGSGALGSGSSGLTDGDKGDITITAGVWTIDNTAVNFAKIQNISTSRILGRTTASSGSIEELLVGSGLTLASGSLKLGGTLAEDLSLNGAYNVNLGTGTVLTSFNVRGTTLDIRGSTVGLSRGTTTQDLRFEMFASTGAFFTDSQATKHGIQYADTGYVTQLHSLTDKEYVDSRLAGLTLAAPISTDDKKSIRYNHSLTSFEYYTRTGSIIIEFYNGGSDLTTGIKDTPVLLPYGAVVTGWEIMAYDASNALLSTSCVIDVLSDSFANLPLIGTDSVAGSEKPTLSASSTASNNTITTWSNLTSGNYIQGEIESVGAGVKKIVVVIKLNKI